MAITPLSFRWEREFVARIDLARGDVPRSTFVRRAVEARLGVFHQPGPDVSRVQSTAQAKRGVVARPKGKQ